MEKKYIEVNEGELIRWRGLWSAETETYALGDVVTHAKEGYGTCTYKATVGHVPDAVTEPEVGGSWETVWEVFLMGGQNGDGAGTGDVLSSGVAGGQTIYGGTGSGESLNLISTSHATKGPIVLNPHTYYPETLTDKISLYGNRYNLANGYVIGVEATCLYLRANGVIRFYSACVSDGGTSDFAEFGPSGVTLPALGCTTLVCTGLTINGSMVRTGRLRQSVLNKTANYTITDADPDIVVIGAITALNDTTITLPTAADNIGRIITVIINGDPGTKNVIVDGEGSETINGATTKTNSDIYSFLRLLCNGTGWNIIGSGGSWY